MIPPVEGERIRKWQRLNTTFTIQCHLFPIVLAFVIKSGRHSRRELQSEYTNESGATRAMKATGIVRRIDDLGRVVIPKEIRRTLRIREGDPLEIFVDRDGEVILKKYSPIGELGDFAKEYAESLSESTGHIAMISDRDTFIAVAGASKKEYLDKAIGNLLESCMENRKIILETSAGSYEILRDTNETISSFVAAPIVAGGDPIGTVVLLSKDEQVRMADMESKMVETAAGFLAKQMEQ
jgi:AbrB family transcriptional regulator (stage V sporulation protein T)